MPNLLFCATDHFVIIQIYYNIIIIIIIYSQYVIYDIPPIMYIA